MKLRRVARNVSDIQQLSMFYQHVLGFEAMAPAREDPTLATALGVTRVATQSLSLGNQTIELTQCFPPSAPQMGAAANAQNFQHIAIVTTDIVTAFTQATKAGTTAISTGGPVRLPAAAGGVIAWKFRDPDGHPLEFLQFPDADIWAGTNLFLGYDHSAIAVTNAERSIGFYQSLGLTMAHRQTNHGDEQCQLDGLANAVVDVIAMMPAQAPPHVELLAYQPPTNAAPPPRPQDLMADRLVFDNATSPIDLRQDLDEHFILLDNRNEI